jgi:MFS transporter, PPP family, 3-phenylpropionic acid transporter
VTDPEQAPPRDSFALRLAFLYAALATVFGIQLPFFPLWLKTKGLDPQAIGLVLAAPIVVRIVAVPLINRAVDYWAAPRAALIALAAAAALLHAVVGLASGFAAILLTVALAAVAFQPCSTLIDAYALRGLGLRKRHYGPVRLWGSAAFIAANLASGLLLDFMAADRLIWLIVAALSVMALAASLLLPLDRPGGQTDTSRSGKHHWSSPGFLSIALAAAMIQASHALYYNFSALDWTTKGIDSRTVGLLWALGVVCEIALFAVSGRLRISLTTLVGLGAAGAAVRWTAMAFEPPLVLLPLLQCLHGLSFGATHLGAVQWVARATRAGQAGAAQGDFGTVLAVAAAVATGFSGMLYDAFGGASYLAMAGMAVLGGAFVFLAHRQRRDGEMR